MKKVHSVLKICILILVAAAFFTGGCFVMDSYYANADFGGGTWINGIYCAGKSIEEVNAGLIAEEAIQEVTVYDRENNAYAISVAAFGERPCENFADAGQYDYSYEADLESISLLQKAATGNSVFGMFQKKEYQAEAQNHAPVQMEKLLSHLEGVLPILQETIPKEQRSVSLKKAEDGYFLVNEKENYLDKEKAAMAVYNAVLHSKEEVYLEAEGCYENLPLTAEEQEIVKLWEQVNLFQTAPITYLFGAESEVLDASVRSEFIALTGSEKEPIIRDAAYEYTKQDFIWSEDGALTVDEAAVTAYVDTLAAKYDTYNGIHHFNATRGEVVTIEGGTYGNQLDKKAETEYLLTAVLEQTPQTREPVYKHKALYQGSDDIGSTYIEIDMGQQMMYYYENGEIVLETPVVTGNTGRRMGTPARVCYVYNKQRNRVLRGPGYASPVKYWMPVNGNIGIHDASWRKEFGGEIYKTNGSHGCINTPTEIMAELYEKVEIGTPVVMFY